jgi:twitching motility protein PilT
VVGGFAVAKNEGRTDFDGAMANALRDRLPTLAQILAKAVEAKASDVHIHAGSPLQMRLGGTLRELRTGVLDAPSVEFILKDALSAEDRAFLNENLDFDTALVLPNVGRFRASFYRQQRGWDAVFRPIAAEPPTLEQLGLPASLKRLTEYHQGLVLVTGPAGCGKSSTLAALVSLLNAERHDHIITVEDPIEFVHQPRGCLVNQRQAGKHTRSFANALRAALREDPDIIVIGELRDLETIQLAITAAETGHLVLATLHTNNAIRTINRILDVFPPKQQSQIRAMVSSRCGPSSAQRLVMTADNLRRVPALEVLFVKPSVSNLIREEKTFQIRSHDADRPVGGHDAARRLVVRAGESRHGRQGNRASRGRRPQALRLKRKDPPWLDSTALSPPEGPRRLDLHLAAGMPPHQRQHGEAVPMTGWQPFSDASLREHLKELTTEAQWRQFEANLDLDFAYAPARGGPLPRQLPSTRSAAPGPSSASSPRRYDARGAESPAALSASPTSSRAWCW